MKRRLAGGLAALFILIAGFVGWAALGNRQSFPRENDRVLTAKRSPDGVLEAFLVMRDADSLSSDVLKVFVARAGQPWHEGKMLMLGRRFTRLGEFDWVTANRLCLHGSAEGVEEQEERVRIAGRQIDFRIAADADGCDAAFEAARAAS